MLKQFLLILLLVGICSSFFPAIDSTDSKTVHLRIIGQTSYSYLQAVTQNEKTLVQTSKSKEHMWSIVKSGNNYQFKKDADGNCITLLKEEGGSEYFSLADCGSGKNKFKVIQSECGIIKLVLIDETERIVKIQTANDVIQLICDPLQSQEQQKEGSQEEGSQEEGSQEEGNQEEGNQEEGNQEEGNQEEGNQEEGNQEEGNQEEGNQEEGNQEEGNQEEGSQEEGNCLLYTSPSPRDRQKSRMPSSA
eukprot:TRINITY_DN711_c0_g1_i14.p2 TRINITY_DN711_c0_g1~~TRINITY_DN711_c0_g1_i14.p2  ORF type:complete len:248 (+),score=72.91 TRINITY_DN711_c0_g1_i14:184-927(+)